MVRGNSNNTRGVGSARGGWTGSKLRRVVKNDSDDDEEDSSGDESDRLSVVTMIPAQVAAYPCGDSNDGGKTIVRFPPLACLREKDRWPKALHAGLLGSNGFQEATSAARPVNEIVGARSGNGGEAVTKPQTLRCDPLMSTVVSTDGGMALGDNGKVVAWSADGEPNGSSSSDAVRGVPGSDLHGTIPLIAPLLLGSFPTGATLRSGYGKLGRREDVKLWTDEAELLPRALEPSTYEFLLSNDDELISVRVGSNDPRPVKLAKRLYESLDTSRLDKHFIPLRRLYLRYAFMQLDKVLREVIETRGEYANIEDGDIDALLRRWTNTCRHYEMLFVGMYREIDGLLRDTIAIFSEHPEANAMGQRDAEEQVYGHVRARLQIIHSRYTACWQGVKAFQKRWKSGSLMQIRDVLTDNNALWLLDCPLEFQPTWDPYGEVKSDSRIPCPAMPKVARLPDADVWTIVHASKIPFAEEEQKALTSSW